MDHRLEKLKRARESARERQTRFSILALLLSSLQGFVEFQVTLDQLDESVEEVSEILHALLEELDNQPLASPMLILNLEKALEVIESSLAGESLTEAEAEAALLELGEIDKALSQFALSDHYLQAKQSRQKFDLSKAAMEKIEAWELEAGHYDRIAGQLDDLFLGLATQESVLQYLEGLYEVILGRLESYNQTIIKPEEWTLEVALADEFMLDGFEFWLDGLEILCDLCSGESVEEELVLEPLEMLRQGNRYWLTVEKLAQ